MIEQGTNTNERLVLTFDYLPCVNYSMMNSGVETCNTFVIENNDEKDWHHIVVSITGNSIKDSITHIDSLDRGRSIQLKTERISPDPNVPIETTESLKAAFRLKIEEEGGILWEREYPISLLAYEQ